MKKNIAPAARGLIVGLTILAFGLSAAISRILAENATTNSLFFIALFCTAGGAVLIIRSIQIARRRTISAS